VTFAQPRSAGSLVEATRLDLADGPRANAERADERAEATGQR
jgi:hypothetical protein